MPEIDCQGASPASNTGMGGTLRRLKKRVKLGLLAEAGEGEGSEEGPRAKHCYKVFSSRTLKEFDIVFDYRA